MADSRWENMIPSLNDTLVRLSTLTLEKKFEVAFSDMDRKHQHVNSTKSSRKRELCERIAKLYASRRKLIMSSAKSISKRGTGLTNEIGEFNNSFLNAVIQSLWHLRCFKDEILLRSPLIHVPVGDPCVVCALHEIFIALSIASTEKIREAVDPASLRVALNNMYPDSKLFEKGQMSDASEALGLILNCLHRSFNRTTVTMSNSKLTGSWDCTKGSYIAHSIFGMDMTEFFCCNQCCLMSSYLKYTSFFHYVNARDLRMLKVRYPRDLRMLKVRYPDYSFVQLMSLTNSSDVKHCDEEVGGCGKMIFVSRSISKPPRVYNIVLGWQSTSESFEDVRATFAVLSTDIDLKVLYGVNAAQSKGCLVSMVCYYGQHHCCFSYNQDHEEWIMYDDEFVKVIGSCNGVITMCGRLGMQPQVLFFEAIN